MSLNGNDNNENEMSVTAVDNSVTKVSLKWTNLSYTIQERNTFAKLAKFKFRDVFKSQRKVILHPQNGHITTGCLMAIIGKSGSGKSTLLESLTGRRVKNVTGDITVNIETKFSSLYGFNGVKISFIPQKDYLLESFTVKESLLFASKIKNLGVNKKQHGIICNDLLEQFDLKICKHIRVSQCSGGQKKRLSVALELVSKPTILVIDEPTSGLDSLSAYQCIELLKNLTFSTKNPVAIIVSIHQPNAKILSQFHKLYLLSHNGQCIYNGSVNRLLDYFTQFNLQCPPFHNPADFAIEVASGDYGEEVVKKMSSYQTSEYKECLNVKENCEEISILCIIKAMRKHSISSFFPHTWLLLIRAMISTTRDSHNILVRTLAHLFVALFLVSMCNNDMNKVDGCVSNGSGNDFSTYFSIDKLRHLQSALFQNLGFIFITIDFLVLVPMLIKVVLLPKEIHIFLRERTNGWYSCLAFYLAKTIADIPFQIMLTSVFTGSIYYFTGQPNDSWRFVMFVIISNLTVFLCESFGMVIGAIWVENITAAIFAAPISMMPFMLLSGIFIRLQLIPLYLKPIASVSFFRFALEAFILCIYGFNRCDHNSDAVNGISIRNESLNSVITRFVNYISKLELTYSNTRPILHAIAISKNQSLAELQSFYTYFEKYNRTNLENITLFPNKSMIVEEFELEDYQLYYNISMLIIITLILQFLAYFILFLKGNKLK